MYKNSMIIIIIDFRFNTVITMSSGGSLQTLKEGTLYKRGKINTEWRQRQFVLNGKQLSYFKGGVSSGLNLQT